MIFPVDLTAFPEAVRKRMAEIWKREDQMAYQMAKVRQEKIARFYQDNAPRWRDGFGPMFGAIDPYWMSYFEMNHGEEAGTKEFLDFLAKKEPMFGVKAVSPKLQ